MINYSPATGKTAIITLSDTEKPFEMQFNYHLLPQNEVIFNTLNKTDTHAYAHTHHTYKVERSNVCKIIKHSSTLYEIIMTISINNTSNQFNLKDDNPYVRMINNYLGNVPKKRRNRDDTLKYNKVMSAAVACVCY